MLASMTNPSKVTVDCPDCGAELVVDVRTGKVLLHKPVKAPAADLDALLQGLDDQKARAESVFEREKAALEDRERLLDEKFEEAKRRAEEEPDEPIVRPWDLD